MARVAVDLDGVIYDFVGALRSFLVKNYGYHPADLPSPTTWSFFPEWGLTMEKFDLLCDEATDAGVMFIDGAPIPGSMEALNTLLSMGHSIHIVTARNFGTRSEQNTRTWLDIYKVPRHSLTFAHEKSILDADIFVDDKPSNVDNLVAAGKFAWLLRDPTCPGRNDADGHPRLIESWDAFLDLVQAVDRHA